MDNCIRLILTSVLSLSLIVSAATSALTAPNSRGDLNGVTELQPIDLALAPGGILRGRVLDESGRVESRTKILLCDPRGNFVQLRTNPDGTFAVVGIQGGIYQIIHGENSQLVRAWAASTAPPVAVDSVILKPSAPLMRGQWTAPPLLNTVVQRGKVAMANPVVVGGILAAAVGIPVFVHNINQDDAPVSP